ncbi:cobalamin-binding protein [Massilia sp. TSP1-1-2]|uniref:cobalamin-binding protein n=1 Tax=unclassified Massilia TaxID=2609279 RepID=UPI003CFB21C8
MLRFTIGALLALAAASSGAAISVLDDSGARVVLQRPAQRVISMAPHVTELLFAAGGGARVVGAINYSDYPEAARRVPVVGSSSELDMERVLALKPDLLVVWQSGNTARQLEQLRQTGIPIFYSEPTRLEHVADSLTRFGVLLGTEPAAQETAQNFRAKIAALEKRYARRSPVRLFYQIWDKPLFTLNNSQIASDAIRLCGGVNIFGQLKVKAPMVSTEAVLEQNPEAIIGSVRDDSPEAGLNMWRAYKGMLAVRRNNLFSPPESLTRAGPRMAAGVADLCEKLELARQRRR